MGKSCRTDAPRSSHAEWEPRPDRRDSISLLEEQAAERVPELVPIRYGRMSASPFGFFRGAAYVMASDLAGSPQTGIRVQLCGDAHLANFGAFASPERQLLFDLNDFDETLPGPWEWDVKRLAASVAVAGRENARGDRAAGCDRDAAGRRVPAGDAPVRHDENAGRVVRAGQRQRASGAVALTAKRKPRPAAREDGCEGPAQGQRGPPPVRTTRLALCS
jgi:Uncharacterized protein conserved in bacteria (DUF2252)